MLRTISIYESLDPFPHAVLNIQTTSRLEKPDITIANLHLTALDNINVFICV